MVLIGISLVINNGTSFLVLVFHPHIHLVKCLFTSFDHFLIRLFVFFLLWVIFKYFIIIKSASVNIICKMLPSPQFGACT